MTGFDELLLDFDKLIQLSSRISIFQFFFNLTEKHAKNKQTVLTVGCQSELFDWVIDFDS